MTAAAEEPPRLPVLPCAQVCQQLRQENAQLRDRLRDLEWECKR